MKLKKYLFIFIPLFLGILIYLIYRSRSLFYFKIFRTHNDLHNFVINIRELGWQYRKYFPRWSIYSLPDGLWLFSFGVAILYERIFYLLHFTIFTLIYLIMIAIEYIQKFYGGTGSFIGTFDLYDIYAYTIAYFSICIITSTLFLIKNRKNHDNYNKNLLKIEFFYDIKVIIVFIILGTLPSLF